jgi:hypothetical protein
LDFGPADLEPPLTLADLAHELYSQVICIDFTEVVEWNGKANVAKVNALCDWHKASTAKFICPREQGHDQSHLARRDVPVW